MKRLEFFKDKNIKDYNLHDIANLLKYEFHPKDTELTNLGRNNTFTYLDGANEKCYIIVSGTINIQKPRSLLNNESGISFGTKGQ